MSDEMVMMTVSFEQGGRVPRDPGAICFILPTSNRARSRDLLLRSREEQSQLQGVDLANLTSRMGDFACHMAGTSHPYKWEVLSSCVGMGRASHPYKWEVLPMPTSGNCFRVQFAGTLQGLICSHTAPPKNVKVVRIQSGFTVQG